MRVAVSGQDRHLGAGAEQRYLADTVLGFHELGARRPIKPGLNHRFEAGAADNRKSNFHLDCN
jgi:hypothetical protein